MNRAFRIATDLVHATVEYHQAARSGDRDEIRRAFDRMVMIQNELSATCEDLAAAAE